jgi:hypothetical protein
VAKPKKYGLHDWQVELLVHVLQFSGHWEHSLFVNQNPSVQLPQLLSPFVQSAHPEGQDETTEIHILISTCWVSQCDVCVHKQT